MQPLTIYCNADFPSPAAALLRERVQPHRLLLSRSPVGVLGRGGRDPGLDEADVAFGQPDADQIVRSPRLGWVQLTSASYTAYDRADLRLAFEQRGATLTKSSLVYAEPCALHLLAFMTAEARQLPRALQAQQGPKDWPQARLRQKSRLLRGESVVIVGFGAIGRRLSELLAPLEMRVSAVRRHVAGDEPVPTFGLFDLTSVELVSEADHVINILPASSETHQFFDAQRFSSLKPGAIFYNVGRGSTVDQAALLDALRSGRLAAAYLDVTDPEPLPADHPLWAETNCFITPHTAGGHADEALRLVQHFLDNLRRFTKSEPLRDRVFG